MHHLEALWNAHVYKQNPKMKGKILLGFVEGTRVMQTGFWASGLAYKNT